MSNVSKPAKLAMIQAFASYLDSGSGAATVQFYDDTQPTDTTTAAVSTARLATLTFPEPCFKLVTSDYVELHPTNVSTVVKTGVATWARVFNGSGVATMDLTIGSDISLANTSLVSGGNLSITSILLRA